MVQSDIVNEVEARIHRDDKTARIKTLINIILKKLSCSMLEDGTPVPLECLKKPDGSNTITIADGDYKKALPSDFIWLYDDPIIQYDTNKAHRMVKKPLYWFTENYPDISVDTSSKSRPYFYMIKNKTLYFAPRSDDSYTIVLPYTFLHPDISDDNSTIYFPDEWLDCIVNGVLWLLRDELGDDAGATKHFNLFTAMARNFYLAEKRQAKMGVEEKPVIFHIDA